MNHCVNVSLGVSYLEIDLLGEDEMPEPLKAANIEAGDLKKKKNLLQVSGSFTRL